MVAPIALPHRPGKWKGAVLRLANPTVPLNIRAAGLRDIVRETNANLPERIRQASRN
jgi:hypothetical protein